MINTWRKLQQGILKSHLRWPLYVITIAFGIFIFTKPSLSIIMSFIFFLGVTALFEGIHPTGTWKYRTLIPDIIPDRIQQIIIYIKRVLFILTGLYLIILVIMMVVSHLLETY